MTFAKRLCALLPLVYPKFYTIADTFGHEFVLLAKSTGELPPDACFSVLDRTEFEAERNCIQLFDRLRGDDCADVLFAGKALAENLLNALKAAYPEKKFVVTLEINLKTATCIRFHQLWSGEEPFVSQAEKRKNTEEITGPTFCLQRRTLYRPKRLCQWHCRFFFFVWNMCIVLKGGATIGVSSSCFSSFHDCFPIMRQ